MQDCERYHLIKPIGKRRRGGKLRLGEILSSSWRCFSCPRFSSSTTSIFTGFVSLMEHLLFVPLCLLLDSVKGKHGGIYFIDRTKPAVRHDDRINRNRMFKGMAKGGGQQWGGFMVSNYLSPSIMKGNLWLCASLQATGMRVRSCGEHGETFED